MTTVQRPIKFVSKGRRKRALVGTALQPERPAIPGRVPRVSRLMALAIRYDQLLRDGVVANQTQLARLAHVTQPRMTQIMNLLHLASDIQEEILFLPPAERRQVGTVERNLRSLTAEPIWSRQRSLWRQAPDIS